MRRKVTTKPARQWGRTQGDLSSNISAKEKTPLTPSQQTEGLTKTPTGKGLGKAGARRLGRLLKRAIQDQKELTVRGKLALPKTPVRLFKHQIQSEVDNVSTTNTAQTKQASHHASQLILSVVSHCKNRGGISMAELKQTLAAAGYDMTKNNRKVNVMTKRLVNNETLVQTTRNATIRLSRKKVTDTTHLRMTSVKSPKPHEDLKTSKTASKSPKATKRSQKQTTKTPKQRDKSHRPTGKTRRQAAVKPSSTQTKREAQKPKAKTRKPTAKSQKLKKQDSQASRQIAKTKKQDSQASRQIAKTKKQDTQARRQITKTKIEDSQSKTKTHSARKDKKKIYSEQSCKSEKDTQDGSEDSATSTSTKQENI